MITFVRASTFTGQLDSEPGTRIFNGEISDDWRQGKGTFGGLQLAAALRAMGTWAEGRRPLAIQGHFCATCRAGPVLLTLTEVRRGRRLLVLNATLTQSERVVAVFSASFGTPGPATLNWQAPASPATPDWREVESLAWAPPLPIFLKHFDVRFHGGHPPYSGAEQASISGFVKLADDEEADSNGATLWDAALIAACADVYPPASLSRAQGFAAAVSVSLQVTFMADFSAPIDTGTTPALPDPAEPVFVSVHAPWADAGYAENHASLYSVGGTLLARCHQVFAFLDA